MATFKLNSQTKVTINGLCGVVHEQIGQDVRNGDAFIFINGYDKKILVLANTRIFYHANPEPDISNK